ncbi:hypothetical protein ACS0TY_015859 [Phlomoides rotata]
MKIENYVVWRRNERLVKGWILGALVDELVRDVSDPPLLGRNALHIAALTGNTDAARLLVDRVQGLVYEQARKGWFPIHAAARSAHRATLEFLLLETSDSASDNPYDGQSGVLLLCLVIDAGFYDIALSLVEKSAHRATLEFLLLETSDSASDNPYDGQSGVLLLCLVIDAGFYDIALSLVEKYPDIALSLVKYYGAGNIIHEGVGISQWSQIGVQGTLLMQQSGMSLLSVDPRARPESPLVSMCQTRYEPTCSVDPRASIPRILHVVGDFALETCHHPHHETRQDTEFIQTYMLLAFRFYDHSSISGLGARAREEVLKHQHAKELLKCLCRKMAEAYGNEEVASIYNSAMMTAARLGIHETKECKHRYSDTTDFNGNTVLHLVAKLAPPHKLNLVSGAALQMQSELQWFKEVENFVHPYAREEENDDGKTPKMVFREEHKRLKEEGEKWMKDTSNSYIIVAALIVTVVFAAAITVPGGNNSNSGYPMLDDKRAFIVFAISDVGSLFTSITSLLMFLSIMTSRYAEEDFLYALPMRLSFGLFTLFVSIILLMVAFCASTYLVLGRERKWVLILVAALASLPVASFVFLQFPLLVAVVSSTYGRGIFYNEPQLKFIFQGCMQLFVIVCITREELKRVYIKESWALPK